MADTLETTTPRLLKVDGRDPSADESIAVSDPTILSFATQPDGTVLVTGLLDGVATITVAPGAADVNRLPGTDDITVITPVPPTPLVVSLA